MSREVDRNASREAIRQTGEPLRRWANRHHVREATAVNYFQRGSVLKSGKPTAERIERCLRHDGLIRFRTE